MISEVWKPVMGYEGLYEISNFGRVKSVPRSVSYALGYTRRNSGKILKLSSASNNPRCNYYRVSLSKNNQVTQFNVHRLVAEHFINKGNEDSVVNHIDGNKQNNRFDNLEWTTPRKNKIHAVYTGLDIPHYGIKPVVCLTSGKTYPSISEAARRLNIIDTSIGKVCRGERKLTKGMAFSYAPPEGV